jgi:hypothetical protein
MHEAACRRLTRAHRDSFVDNVFGMLRNRSGVDMATVLAYIRTDPGVLGTVPAHLMRRVSRAMGRLRPGRLHARADRARQSDDRLRP